jgi:uncharacterized protein (UPF0332 family)
MPLNRIVCHWFPAMQPLEFVLLANTLLANRAEAAQRSAVSRAYYGAFNAAKVLIESCGFRFSNSSETHEKLPYCLDQSGDEELKVAKAKLKSLRSVRNDADYELDDRRFLQPAFAALQVQIAREILDALRQAAIRIPAFRGKVREYARDVLKKPLRDND